MKKILLTGFEPFSRWNQNSSAMCVSAISRREGLPVDLTTRIYPVDFDRAKLCVERDLNERSDFALHLGQHEMSTSIRLERVARNLRPSEDGQARPLLRDGPTEIRTSLPLRRWSRLLKREGIPVAVSNDAGCYLCNAVYYWSLCYSARNSIPTQSVFIHLPLAKTQVFASVEHLPSLETEICANAVEAIIRELAGKTTPPPRSQTPTFALRDASDFRV